MRILGRPRTAYAHCDLPCGIYDPAQARIEAESCYKIIEKHNASKDPAFQQRAILIKEQRADMVKHHLDVLWHDYFKPEHLEKFPELHDLFWKAAKQASAVKGSLDQAEATKLLEMIDKIDDIWRKTGGLEKSRVPKPEKKAA